MALQLDPSETSPEPPLSFVFSLDSVFSSGDELALSHELLLFGLTLVGASSDAVPLLCQQLATLTRGRATIQLFQASELPGCTSAANAAFVLVRDHEYTIYFQERYYGWLATSEEPELSPLLLKHLARLCGVLFFLYEVTAFLSAQVELTPHLLTHELSERQRDVLMLMACGDRDQQIAQGLSIDPATVRKHREGIYHKLGVHSSSQAVLAAFLSGLHHSLTTLAPLIMLDEA